ncbi:TrmB family transcriptional regulator [Nanoarchaeota archaeon]
MLVENKTLKKIKDLGLNSYEAKIWTALLSRGVSTAGEISDIANVPRSRSYDVLESLEKKGFIIMKVGKPIQYIAVPPDEVLERVKKAVQIDAEQKVEILVEFENSNLLTDLRSLHTEGIESVDPTEIAGYIKTRANIQDQMSSLLKNARKSAYINTTSEGLNEVQAISRSINKAVRNNVSIKISSPGNININGCEIKSTILQGRFMIVDSEKVLFWITSEATHPSYETAIWVESQVLAKTFEQTFKNAWGTVETTLKATVKKKVQH